MKTEKKLIACSILALIIGVSSVFPLVFLMTATAKADNSNEPWFSINMPYAYWVTNDGPLTDFAFELPWDSGLNETNSVSEQHILMLNLTLNVDTTNEVSDGRVEYYTIEIISDKELIETMNFFVGTNSNGSFTFDEVLDDIHFTRDDWFDTDLFNQTYGGGGGLLKYNWTVSESQLFDEGGSGEGTLGGSGTSLTVTQLREAQTVTVTIYRLGWATFTSDSTTFTTANNEVVDQIQLEKYGEEGWIYNNLIPEDELAETDLLHPLSYEEMYQVQSDNGQ
ncbi:MAG: hypothetical protein NWF06_00655 [Candidatus Bathyarchaeota archaeon]|nr:hypothetical protein [Candidatus Bathyarchaeum sp.]